MASKSGFRVAALLMIQWLMMGWAEAQYFTWGTEPASTRWMQHEGTGLTLIYPAGFKSDSSYLLVLDSAIVYQSQLMHCKPKKLNIVLHPNTLLSNGFVAWAPRRSELFVMPSRDFYPGFWPQQLAWHEMRHYAQLSVAQQQLRKRAGFLFGEQITAAFVGLLVPTWFIEGDATASETAFLPTGRGRSATFSAPLFAWLDANPKIPSYDRTLLGSYNQYNPDEYLFGYWLVANGSRRYGAQFWPQVYAETFMRNNFSMFPRTFKKTNTEQVSLHHFHHQSLSALRDSVQQDLSLAKLTPLFAVTNSHEYASYRPLGTDSFGNVIAFRKEMHGEPCFVRIDSSGHEKVIRYTHLLHDESFGFDGHFIYYAEYKPHPRREMVDFSSTCKMDIYSGEVKVYSQLKKELLPTCSPNGKVSASCAYYPDGSYCVTAFHSQSGNNIGTAFLPYTEQPISMAVDDSGNSLFLIIQTEHERKLVELNSAHKSTKTLLSVGDRNISNLILQGEYLYFDANLNGNEEIYRIATAGGLPECITNTAFGAYFPVFDSKGGLLFSELTASGYQIRRLTEIQTLSSNKRWEFMYHLADTLSAQNKRQCDTIRIPALTTQKEEPYRQGKHLINVHSWGPFTIDPSESMASPGIQFDSQNMLSTLTASIFSGYSLSTKTLNSGFRVNYEGWFPVLSIGFNNELPFRNNADHSYYNSLNLSSWIPLVFTRHAWTLRLNPAVEIRPWGTLNTGDTVYTFSRYSAWLTGSAARYTNNRNVYPRLGAYFGSGVFAQTYDHRQGFLAAGYAGVWLPGLFRHDGFRLRGGYESRDTLALPFSTMMTAPRGYNLLSEPVKAFGSAEYGCPLLYPDFHLGSLFYLKRFTGYISYDYGIGPDDGNFSSLGFHLHTDIHFLRLYVPVRLVYSLYYLMPSKQFTQQFGLSYNFYAY